MPMLLDAAEAKSLGLNIVRLERNGKRRRRALHRVRWYRHALHLVAEHLDAGEIDLETALTAVTALEFACDNREFHLSFAKIARLAIEKHKPERMAKPRRERRTAGRRLADWALDYADGRWISPLFNELFSQRALVHPWMDKRNAVENRSFRPTFGPPRPRPAPVCQPDRPCPVGNRALSVRTNVWL